MVYVFDGQVLVSGMFIIDVFNVNEVLFFLKMIYFVIGNEGVVSIQLLKCIKIKWCLLFIFKWFYFQVGVIIGMLVFVVIDLERDMIIYLFDCVEFIFNSIFGVLMFISDYDVDVGFVIIVFCGVMVFDGSLIDMVIFVVNINNINDNILIFF